MALAMSTETPAEYGMGHAERERILGILRQQEAALRARGVKRLRLFGSLARGEAGLASDIDLLAEIERGSGFSLLDLVDLQHELGDLTGRKVEIGTAVERMRPRVRKRVEADAIEVF
jgi:predicted nucleotidyltransferase